MTEKTAETAVAGDSQESPATQDEASQAWAEFEQADNPKGKEPEEELEGGDDQTADKKDGEEPSKDKAEEKPAEKTEAKPDIWANAPPELKAAYEAAEKKARDLEHRKKSDDGRVATYQRQVKALTDQISELQKGKKDGATQASSEKKAGEISDKLAKLKTDYPEIAEPIEHLEGRLNDALKKIDSLTSEFSGISKERSEKQFATQEKIVLEAHKDYDAIAESDEFYAWYAQSPAFIKAGVERNARGIVDGHEVKKIIDLFKLETGKVSTGAVTATKTEPADKGQSNNPAPADPHRKRQLESASSPRSKSLGPTPSGIPDDPEGAWNAFERMGL